MNLLLLTNTEYHKNLAIVKDSRKIDHIRTVLKAKIKDSIKCGLLNGACGTLVITKLDEYEIHLEGELSDAPPAKLPCTIIVAMPRPKTFRKVIHYACAMGVKEMHFIRSWRVDKSYFQSPALKDQAIDHDVQLALEQACDTVAPTITIHKEFRPFVEDRLPAIAKHSRKLVAHPYNATACPHNISEASTLVIGPEGGFIPFEVELLNSLGFSSITLGPRILRVENAVPAILGRLYL